jgi:hypothetical protein
MPPTCAPSSPGCTGKKSLPWPFSVSMSWARVTPASKVIIRSFSSSSTTLLRRSSERIILGCVGMAPATTPVPPPRTVTGSFTLFAYFKISDISFGLAGFTTTHAESASGRKRSSVAS